MNFKTYEDELEAARAAFEKLTEADEPMVDDAFARAERRFHNARRALAAVLDSRRRTELRSL